MYCDFGEDNIWKCEQVIIMANEIERLLKKEGNILFK